MSKVVELKRGFAPSERTLDPMYLDHLCSKIESQIHYPVGPYNEVVLTRAQAQDLLTVIDQKIAVAPLSKEKFRECG